jgi:hypothetical protein
LNNAEKTMMNPADPFGDRKLIRLQLLIYLLPFIGVLPAAWTLYRGSDNPRERSLSRLSVKLTLGWLIAYGLLGAGSFAVSDALSLRLLYADALLTSGYVLASLGMMLKIWREK